MFRTEIKQIFFPFYKIYFKYILIFKKLLCKLKDLIEKELVHFVFWKCEFIEFCFIVHQNLSQSILFISLCETR